ncbi:MAG: MGMT family protein [Candidatus Omnitrophica bacterium]|nr:MGMT family protein [Candidatus Omnitrophota bacterium]
MKRFTPFQRKVYRAVLTIPKGHVRTYKWIAEHIGKPNASRAVGGALNRNPHTVIIPCHRVIGSNGSLGGYSKGIQMKKRLLNKEGLDVHGYH